MEQVIEQIRAMCLKVLDVVLQNPQTDTEMWTVAAIAVVVTAFVFGKVSDKLDLPNVGMFNSIAIVILGCGLIVVGIAATEIYLPDLAKQVDQLVLYAGITVAVSLVIIIPMVNSYIHGKFFGTMGAWSIALVTLLLTVMTTQAVLGSIRDGERMLQRGRDHNEATKKMINNK